MRYVIYVNLNNLNMFNDLLKNKEIIKLNIEKIYLLFSTEIIPDSVGVILSEEDFYFLYDNYIKPIL